MKKTIAIFTCLFIGLISINTEVLITDLGGNQFQITIEPIIFEIVQDSNAAHRAIIEGFFLNNQVNAGNFVSGTIDLSFNGGAPVSILGETSIGTFNNTVGIINANDLLINYTLNYEAAGGQAVGAGDIVTLSTNNLIFENANFIPGTATGDLNAVLFNGTTTVLGTQTVRVGVVPEPSTYAILGLLGLVVIRTRKKKVA
ncbi:PEP-CTERM sorting domain-containing protein [Candidatus Uabimicrobium sp. HlEnr_7]|uniref:PEP-CTERM sorting domain-containing protein n=1 Tax=Candidatus Uabimicrobium helgolandensis TaxID=3095367 RepID=UPI00355803A3